MTKGLYLYKRPNGYYYVGQRLPDNRVKWTTTKCKDRPNALLFFRKYQPVSEHERIEYLLSDFINLLKERVGGEIRESTLWQYTYALTCFKDFIGDKYISRITVGDCEQFKTERMRVTQANSVNIILRSLKACLGRAVKWELMDSNPMLKVSLNRIPKLPPRFLTKEMFDQLCAVVDDEQMVDLFKFAANTGLRLSEITHLRWHFCDTNAKQFTVANTWNWQTKSGKSRTLPISGIVEEIFQRQLVRRYKNTTYVFQKPQGFPLSKDYITHKFAEYRDKAKLPKYLHFHSLRHTFISWSLMAGIDIFTVKEFSGHSDTKLIDDVYGHLTDHHKQDEIRKLDDYQNKKG